MNLLESNMRVRSSAQTSVAMSESPNPYESPERGSSKKMDDPQGDFDKRGMLSLIVATAILGGLDFFILKVGFLVAIGPLVLFFALTFWSVMAGTRTGSMAPGPRVGSGIAAGIVAAPCFYALLMFTCAHATEVAGVGWRLHGGFGGSNPFLMGLVTAVMIALTGLLVFGLFYVIPRASRLKKEKEDGMT